MSSERAVFLGTEVFKGPRFASKHTSKLQKRSNTRISLRHPFIVKKGFIKGETLRLVRTNSIKWKKCWWSVVERWIEEMILTLAGQSQRLSHMYTLKISGVFNGIRTHDLCDAGAVLSPTEKWSHSDASRSIRWAYVFPWKEWCVFETEMNWRNHAHTCWTISTIVSYVHLKNFRCLQQDSNPWPLRCRYSALPNWTMKPLRCKEVNLLGSCVPVKGIIQNLHCP